MVVHWYFSSCLPHSCCHPPGAGLLGSIVPGGCLQAPRALGCVSEVSASPCPASPPRCPPRLNPRGRAQPRHPPLYIAPARPPPAGQVACGFVFLLPSRRRLCLRLSLSRTPHCAGPAPVGNQARKVLGPHRGELLLPLAQQEQGRAPRSFPQLPSILFIERVLGWWLLFNSKAFKRGTNGEILPLAWRAATVLMDFFFLKPPWDSEPLLPPAPLRSCRDRHALRSFNS